jgi:hypothetical protein
MKTLRIVSLLIVLFSLASCAPSKAIYLGPNDFSGSSQISGEIHNAENINGNFPEAVYIKTRTQTFNLYYYFILHEGRIWYKSTGADKEPKDWALFMKDGLPGKTNAVAEISADADELAALSVEGNFYRYCFDKSKAHRSNVWLDRQGWPVEERLYLDSRTAKNRAWALGKRNSHALYYEDPFGNQHHNGLMDVVTTYVLLEDGQEICFSDPGLPSDFSRNFIGPERGTFISVSLSASASTMFVINETGEMYTRLADFNTIGCDFMFYKYTYIPYKSNLQGTDYSSSLNELGLPSEDWLSQPRIPLTGKAAITRHITILQNGQGNGARELRVAGLDDEGRKGYWSKPIFGDTWEFKKAALYFTEDSILAKAAAGYENAHDKRGRSLDKSYTGYQWNGREKKNGWEYQITNFNILEGDCDLRITWMTETCTFKLHPLEMYTYLKRDYLPGRTGSPKIFFVTLEIPENAFESLGDVFVQQLTEIFAKNDRKLFHYTIAATNNYIILWDTDDADSLLFLTDGTITNQYSELHVGYFIENFGEIQRYYSHELTVNGSTAITIEELTEKIKGNKQFVDELKYQIRVLKQSQLNASKFNMSSHIAMFILRFVDEPKIRPLTIFGERLVLTNSTYVYTITTARIRLFTRIVELLETRILCYNDLVKKYSMSSAPANDSKGIVLPQWYSDDIYDYWDIAGFPRTISGTFFAPAAGNLPVEIPAILSFVPPKAGKNISGWFLAIGKSNDFSIFIESSNSAKTIYRHRSKTPYGGKLQIECNLHINKNANTPEERNIIERCLQPYIMGADDSIKTRIIFDGKTFELREYPARRSNPLIFKGTL